MPGLPGKNPGLPYPKNMGKQIFNGGHYFRRGDPSMAFIFISGNASLGSIFRTGITGSPESLPKNCLGSSINKHHLRFKRTAGENQCRGCRERIPAYRIQKTWVNRFSTAAIIFVGETHPWLSSLYQAVDHWKAYSGRG